jgi:hypothetical protein
MTAEQFRSLALEMPEASESSHMRHPDFRVRGKIFATLGPDESWGMVKLTAEQQAEFMRAEPKTFRPAAGAWGRAGCTLVTFKGARRQTVRQAVIEAWRNNAPQSLVREYHES